MSYNQLKNTLDNIFILINEKPSENLTVILNTLNSVNSYLKNVESYTDKTRMFSEIVRDLKYKINNFLRMNISDKLVDFFNYYYDKSKNCLKYFNSINLDTKKYSATELVNICDDYRNGNTLKIIYNKDYTHLIFSTTVLIIAILFFIILIIYYCKRKNSLEAQIGRTVIFE